MLKSLREYSVFILAHGYCRHSFLGRCAHRFGELSSATFLQHSRDCTTAAGISDAYPLQIFKHCSFYDPPICSSMGDSCFIRYVCSPRTTETLKPLGKGCGIYRNRDCSGHARALDAEFEYARMGFVLKVWCSETARAASFDAALAYTRFCSVQTGATQKAPCSKKSRRFLSDCNTLLF